jgi:hypothetical protein
MTDSIPPGHQILASMEKGEGKNRLEEMRQLCGVRQTGNGAADSGTPPFRANPDLR